MACTSPMGSALLVLCFCGFTLFSLESFQPHLGSFAGRPQHQLGSSHSASPRDWATGGCSAARRRRRAWTRLKAEGGTVDAAAVEALLQQQLDTLPLPNGGEEASAKRVSASAPHGGEEASAKRVSASAPQRSARLQTINERLMAEVNAEIEQGTSQFRPSLANIEKEEVDYNGINPYWAFVGAGLAAAMSVAAWKATAFLTERYMAQEALSHSDVYIVNRLSGIFKQVLVGFGSLGAGMFGVTALGIFLLGAKVLKGVASGELDMNATPQDMRRRKSSPEREVDSEGVVDVQNLISRVQGEVEEMTSGAQPKK